MLNSVEPAHGSESGRVPPPIKRGTAPPVYRPPTPVTVAPAVYRPQPLVSQPKTPPGQVNRATPPVFRPKATLAVPAASPPVYRPRPATSQLKAAARIIQRKPGDASKLAEAEVATLTAGGTVKFTSLSAGCMAIMACFAGGGGAALHMAMGHDNASQWNEFLALTNGHTVTQLYIDGDLMGFAQGWFVKTRLDADYLPEPDPTVGPVSALEFQTRGGQTADWLFDKVSLVEWFAAKFSIGKDKVHMSSQTTGISHTC